MKTLYRARKSGAETPIEIESDIASLSEFERETGYSVYGSWLLDRDRKVLDPNNTY